MVQPALVNTQNKYGLDRWVVASQQRELQVSEAQMSAALADVQVLQKALWKWDSAEPKEQQRGLLNRQHTERDLYFLQRIMDLKGMADDDPQRALLIFAMEMHDLTKQVTPEEMIEILSSRSVNKALKKPIAGLDVHEAVYLEGRVLNLDLVRGLAGAEEYQGLE